MTVMTTWTSLRRPLTTTAQRAVDEPAGEDGVLARAALAAEERAGDAPAAYIRSSTSTVSREEVVALTGRLAGRGGRQQHGVVVQVGDDRTGGCLRDGRFRIGWCGAERAVVDRGNGLVHRVSLDSSTEYPSRTPTGTVACQICAGACDVRVVTQMGAGLRSKRSGFLSSPRATTEDRRPPSRNAADVWRAASGDGCSVVLFRCLAERGATPDGSLPVANYRRRPSRSMIDRYRLISVRASS